jgi:hypothetical protein
VPTVFRSGPYRFFFYSADDVEPPHVHVERDDCSAKFWIDPVRLDQSKGFAASEIRRIERVVADNVEQLLRAWHDYFRN